MNRRGAALVALAVLLGLAGCATVPGGGSGTPTPSGDATGPAGRDVAAAWLDDGRGIGLVSAGSGSCPSMASAASYADGVLSVQLDDPQDQACTRDLVMRGTYVMLPAGVDPTEDLAVVVTGSYEDRIELRGDPDLAGVPGDETTYRPSAGWAGDELLLILTWGSSGCVPILESADVVDGAVTVGFVDPPADQVCTMDMAPRITVVDVPGSGRVADLSLAGAEFDGIRLDIAGAD